MTICHDLRFPELLSAPAELRAQLGVCPSSFAAATVAADRHVLSRGRAIETASLVAAAAHAGEAQLARRGPDVYA